MECLRLPNETQGTLSKCAELVSDDVVVELSSWMKGIQATKEAKRGRAVVDCVLDASACCGMIVRRRRMINVMPKGSEGKSWRTCPPTVTANKASLYMGLLKIHTKAEEDCCLFSP